MADTNQPGGRLPRPLPAEIWGQILEIVGEELFEVQIINLVRTEQDLIVTNRADIHQREVWDLFRGLGRICPEGERYVEGILNNGIGFHRTPPMDERHEDAFQGLWVDYSVDLFRLPDDLFSFAVMEADAAARVSAEMQAFAADPYEDLQMQDFAADPYEDFQMQDLAGPHDADDSIDVTNDSFMAYLDESASITVTYDPHSPAYRVARLMFNLTSLEEVLDWADHGGDLALQYDQPSILHVFRPFFHFREIIILVDIQEVTTPEARTVVRRPLDHLSWAQLQYVETITLSRGFDELEQDLGGEDGPLVQMGMSHSVLARCLAVHTNWHYTSQWVSQSVGPNVGQGSSLLIGPAEDLTSATLGLAFISER